MSVSQRFKVPLFSWRGRTDVCCYSDCLRWEWCCCPLCCLSLTVLIIFLFRLFEVGVVLVLPVLSLTVLIMLLFRLFEVGVVLVPPVLSLTVLSDTPHLVSLVLLLPAILIIILNLVKVCSHPNIVPLYSTCSSWTVLVVMSTIFHWWNFGVLFTWTQNVKKKLPSKSLPKLYDTFGY